MKKINLMALLSILLLIPTSVSVGAVVDSTPTWQLTEGTTMVYTIDNLEYNDTGSWPITKYDQGMDMDYPIGELQAGDLLYAHIDQLPDLSGSDDEVRFSLDATRTTESWDYNYSYMVPFDWPDEFNGPPFFMPVSTVPVDPSAWDTIASNWDAHVDFSATYDSGAHTFRLTGGANATLGVEGVDVIWDTQTGNMLWYNATGTQGENNDPYWLEMSFLYFRDESQWGMQWGITTQDMYAFRWDVIEGVDEVEFGGSQEDGYNYVKQGDLMIFNIWNLADPNSEGLYWNATLRTPDWESDFNFEFRDIGEDDGPLTWYPFMPVGNDNFIGNISDEFEAFGATVTVVGDVLNITYTGPDSHESTEWDLTTGIMQTLIYEGQVSETETAHIELNFVYRFSPGGEPVFVSDSFDERYIMDTITNGTDDFLDFGMVGDFYYDNGTRYWKRFMLYEGDIMQTHISREQYWNEENQQTEMRARWYARTSSGYETNAWMDYAEPGLEVYNDGPPALMFVIPTGTETITGETWWNMIGGIYDDLGYSVINDATEFGFSTTVNGLTLTARWEKGTGLLNYYDVQGVDPESGNDVAWVMHRSEYNINGPTDLSWGVAVGTTMEYSFSDIGTPIPFGDHETGSIVNGDIMQVTFVGLGNLQDDGPWVNVDMQVGDVSQLNVSMGLKTPGFEFVSFEDDKNQGDGPPMLYFAIPTGPDSFWNTIEGMYGDAGYTVLNNDTHFGVTIDQPDMYVQGYWAKDTGLMVYYHLDGTFDGQSMVFTAILGSSDVVEPTSSTTSTSTSGTDSPAPSIPVSFTAIIAIPVIAIYRRKRRYN